MVKNPPANAGDSGLTPGLGRSPGEGNGYPLQYSCLGNPMDRVAWQLQSMELQWVGHDSETGCWEFSLSCSYYFFCLEFLVSYCFVEIFTLCGLHINTLKFANNFSKSVTFVCIFVVSLSCKTFLVSL